MGQIHARSWELSVKVSHVGEFPSQEITLPDNSDSLAHEEEAQDLQDNRGPI